MQEIHLAGAESEPLTIAGDGMQTRRFVYVEDLAEGVVAGLADCATDQIYNLAGTETVTIKELAETVGEVVGDTDIVHTPGRSGDFALVTREIDYRLDDGTAVALARTMTILR